MYTRNSKLIKNQSFLLLGPRGVGKTSWIKTAYPDQTHIDLLSTEVFVKLQTNPSRLTEFLTEKHEWVFIDEIQRIPELLNEVHKLIEENKQKFILSGSSARRLRRGGANLLAGRALTNYLFPLTARELGADFSLGKGIRYGHHSHGRSQPRSRFIFEILYPYIFT